MAIERKLARWEDVPRFSSLVAERQFWQTTELDTPLMQASLYTPEGSESTTISLRMDPRMLARIKRLARQRYLNYQSMIKQWLAERLEKESKD
ncbi:MAG TPA: CopG family antitoxin [Verrucomicrobiae bacterium]|nr:CopG family antitoxin [Verrucomicrobiae bacterium]